MSFQIERIALYVHLHTGEDRSKKFEAEIKRQYEISKNSFFIKIGVAPVIANDWQ
ncbi:MAG TPA: hypothetical protein VEY10_03045 [Flavisolibacter sp.]|jgi:hypothetical protein|nr:hypothetical protein [Flavisolibacter sp.]